MQRYAPWAARAAVLLGLAGVVIIGSVRAAVPQPVPAARPQATGIFKPLYSFACKRTATARATCSPPAASCTARPIPAERTAWDRCSS